MLINNRQYALAVRQARKNKVVQDRLVRRLWQSRNLDADCTQIADIESENEVLEAEIQQYRDICYGVAEMPSLDYVRHLPLDLIRVRMRLGWTQKEFARLCGLKPQQVHRLESTRYDFAMLATVMKIAAVLSKGQELRTQALQDVAARRASERPGNLLQGLATLSTSGAKPP